MAASAMRRLKVRRYIVMNAVRAHILATVSAGHAEINYAQNRKSSAPLSLAITAIALKPLSLAKHPVDGGVDIGESMVL